MRELFLLVRDEQYGTRGIGTHSFNVFSQNQWAAMIGDGMCIRTESSKNAV